MKVKLEIPRKDFAKLIEYWNHALETDEATTSGTVRNQIIEKGCYKFRGSLEQGYDHDSGTFQDDSKVVLEIENVPPKATN